MQTFNLKHKYYDGAMDSWKVSWEVLETETDYHKLRISARGSTFDVILGYSSSGNYLCIPDIDIGCALALWSDVFWNTEKLSMLMSETDAATIAAVINHFGNYH